MKYTDQIAAEAEQQIEAIISMRWGEPHHGDIHEAVRQVIKAAIEKATKQVDDYWRERIRDGSAGLVDASTRAAHASEQP